MKDIVAGVVLIFEYSIPDHGVEYSGYLDYENKEIKKEVNHIRFADYPVNYMDKYGLFTSNKDCLDANDIDYNKRIYDLAQENGSPMWRPIISFDNRWLTQMGLYDPIRGRSNDNEIKTAIRKCVNTLITNEKLEGVIWTAGIHHDTDNIHVHISMVQPVPMKDWKKQSPKFKLQSFNRAKSSVVNYMMENQREFNLIHDLSRNKILSKGHDVIMHDHELKNRLQELYMKLPEDKRLWKYNMNAMKPYREEIDQITSIYLDKYCKDDFQLLKGALMIQQQRYEQAYGSYNDYAKNQIDDIYARIGNLILKEGVHYIKMQKLENKENTGNDHTQYFLEDALDRKYNRNDTSSQIRRLDSNVSHINHEDLRNVKNYVQGEDIGLYRIMGSLKNACDTTLAKQLNQRKYHELEQAIEYDKND